MSTRFQDVVSISQTILRLRGQWCDSPAFQRDATAIAESVCRLARVDESDVQGMRHGVVDELSRRLRDSDHRKYARARMQRFT